MNSLSYIKSDAFRYSLNGSSYELTNLITGKSFKISEYIYYIINLFSRRKSRREIELTMKNDNFNDDQTNELLDFLIFNKIILKNRKDAFCDLVKNKFSCFNVGFSDFNKINNKIAFIGVPFGLGNAIDPGCKDFPDKFREISASIFPLNDKFDSFVRKDMIHDSFDIDNVKKLIESSRLIDLGNVYYCPGEQISQFYKNVSSIMREVGKKNIIPVVLGGDHSITYPIIEGLSEVNKDFMILHFDAHCDFKKSDIIKMHEISGAELLNHATVMSYCEKCKEVSSIFQFGVREPSKIDSSKIFSVSIYDIRRKSAIYKEIVNKQCSIYLTFDIDFFDPHLAPGTATKLINGAGYDETFNCISELLNNKKIIGLDIVEVNPRLDPSNQTIQLAMNLSLHLLSLIKN